MQLYMLDLDSRTEVLYVYSAAAAVSLDLYRGAVHQLRVAAELYTWGTRCSSSTENGVRRCTWVCAAIVRLWPYLCSLARFRHRSLSSDGRGKVTAVPLGLCDVPLRSGSFSGSPQSN